MSDSKLKRLKGIFAILLVLIFALSLYTDKSYGKLIDTQVELSSSATELMVELPGQFMIAAFAGFKEVIAGVLWVRADEMFDAGEYQNIPPMIRLITWLDPHNIDVYTTGAWHMDYNFTDDNAISDKRMIPSSIALLEEGCKKNANRYDLFMELGWTHYYRKLNDYDKAAQWLEKARTKDMIDPNSGKSGPRPEYVDRILSSIYEQSGQYEKAINTLKEAIKYAEDLVGTKKYTLYPTDSVLKAKTRLAFLYLRLGWRFGNMDYYKKGLDLAKVGGVRKWAVDAAQKDYNERIASNNPSGDAKKPFDTKLTFTYRKVEPALFECKGTLNIIPISEYKNLASESFTHAYQDNEAKPSAEKVKWLDGSRIKWILQDEDYKMPIVKSFTWKIDRTKTCVWNTERVSKGQFKFNIDLRNRPDMYPLTAPKYKLIIMFDPRGSDGTDPVQDRIGWCGEAMVGDGLDTNMFKRTKIIKKEIILTRADIM